MKDGRLPVLFVGHGSPMNALSNNEYTRDLLRLAARLEKPRGVLVVSAHWLTEGTFVTGNSEPEQIFDFWGFPSDLYEVVYRAPGSEALAGEIVKTIGRKKVKADPARGIDHAAWAVLKFLFPQADVPVLELSLDLEQAPAWQFELGRALRGLREEGVLILGSGNIVHNLREIRWEERAEPFLWAVEFDAAVKDSLLNRDFDRLIDYTGLGEAALLAVPTNEHYLPMLAVLGAAFDDEPVEFIHESIQNGSVSMRSFVLG
jgi:4,5-DOPA dioxygenase extradiol